MTLPETFSSAFLCMEKQQLYGSFYLYKEDSHCFSKSSQQLEVNFKNIFYYIINIFNKLKLPSKYHNKQ